MLESLRIQGFRGLRDLTLAGLRRVNLLVGTNNCGKTSVLEAMHLLSDREAPLWESLLARGEILRDHRETEEFDGTRYLDASQLFYGRRATVGQTFRIAGDEPRGPAVDCSIHADGETETSTFRTRGRERRLLLSRRAAVDITPLDEEFVMSSQGGLFVDHLHWVEGLARLGSARFLTTAGVSSAEVINLFDDISLTPDEGAVIRALQEIEPSIAAVATVRHTSGSRRGGIKVRLSDSVVPIGNLGEGIWRLLGISVVLVSAKGGILLVDEIDTGLHYTVLTKMWRLVLETARRLDVQVVATTHSRDCLEALAQVGEGRDEIAVHRIERDARHSIVLDEAELRSAARRGIEVR